VIFSLISAATVDSSAVSEHQEIVIILTAVLSKKISKTVRNIKVHRMYMENLCTLMNAE
jgi:hypothetical protein